MALSLRQWIPDVRAAVQPWMSAADYQCRSAVEREIERELSETNNCYLSQAADANRRRLRARVVSNPA